MIGMLLKSHFICVCMYTYNLKIQQDLLIFWAKDRVCNGKIFYLKEIAHLHFKVNYILQEKLFYIIMAREVRIRYMIKFISV